MQQIRILAVTLGLWLASMLYPHVLCLARIALAVTLTSAGKVAGASVGYATYLGGSHDEGAAGVAVDSAGNAYVVGTTSSPDFPTTTGRELQGDLDAYVAKFSPDGRLVYSTFVGGPCADSGNAIAVDAAGDAYITGRSGLCSAEGSVAGVLVAKLGPAGELVYLNTFGGSLADSSAGHAIAVDAAGSAYVTGKARSSSHDFPTTEGAFQTTDCNEWLGGGFVAKVNPAGNALVYSTHLCGTSSDTPTAIAVDAAGNAYVAGTTSSHDFPTANAFQPVHWGGPAGETGFVCKLNADGSQLLYSTYLGGSSGDSVTSIAVDGEGNAFVTGGTSGGDFPTTTGVVQATSPFPICALGLCSDAFVTKFSSTGTVLYSTYLAGEGNDGGSGIAVDAAGNAYVSGSTASNHFPIRDAFQRENRGSKEVFITKLNNDASRILFSSYLGGGKQPGSTSLTEGSDEGSGLALGLSESVYVAGHTLSSNFPTTPDVFQPEAVGGMCYLSIEPCGDAFVARITVDGPGTVPDLHLDVTPTELPPGGQVTATWAGIVAPTSDDQLALYRLGERADSTSVLAALPTQGAAAGTLSLPLPIELAPATYELRLMSIDPDFPPLLRVIARSEPITILDAAESVRLVPALESGNLMRLRIDGLSADNHHVEATETLHPPNWEVVATITGQLGSSAEFSEKVNPTAQRRYYRVKKP